MIGNIKICYTVGGLSRIMVVCFMVGIIAEALIWAK